MPSCRSPSRASRPPTPTSRIRVDRPLLEHPRAYAFDDVLAAAVFEDDRVDALRCSSCPSISPAGPAPTMPTWVREEVTDSILT